MGEGARAVRREAAAQCTYQRYVENQRPGLKFSLGAARRYQQVLRRQDVEIRGERSLVSGAHHLVCFRRGGHGGPGGGELLIEGLATRGGTAPLAQRHREGPVIGAAGASYSARAPLNSPCRRSVLKTGSEIAGPAAPACDADLKRLSIPTEWGPETARS